MRLLLLALLSVYSLTVEVIDSHGAGTVVWPFTTGRGIGTETCEMDSVFPPDDSLYECIYIYMSIYITVYLDPSYRT